MANPDLDLLATDTIRTLKELQRRFGFEPERVVAVAKELLGRK
jgi:hypothetical protein